VGAPGDLRGLTAAMYRYLEHRGQLGSTELGLYSIERYARDFIAWADERGVTHPSQVTRAVLERYQRWLYHYRKHNGEPLTAVAEPFAVAEPLAITKPITVASTCSCAELRDGRYAVR
jgi:integrase/recombinase XerD